jgi:hypothetical protein
MDDFSKKIHTQAAEIAKDILVMLADNKDILIDTNLEPTVEEKQKIEEDATDFSNSVINYLASKEIPASYAGLSISKIENAIQILHKFVDGTINSYKDEILSREIGIKNTDGKYRQEDANLGQLLLKLNEVREKTGGKLEDYFNNVPENLQKK